jgi:ADP-ribose pyrophosphatase
MCFLPEGADVDYTASVLIIRDSKILFMKHDKLSKWIQPGGHVEDEETPDQAAKREALEETGYKIQFTDQKQPSSFSQQEDLPTPFNVNVHRIREGHLHCDFMYEARVESQTEATHSHEHSGLSWLSKEDIESGKYDIPDNVRRKAVKILEQNQ